MPIMQIRALKVQLTESGAHCRQEAKRTHCDKRRNWNEFDTKEPVDIGPAEREQELALRVSNCPTGGRSIQFARIGVQEIALYLFTRGAPISGN
jgi:hypothetical protein